MLEDAECQRANEMLPKVDAGSPSSAVLIVDFTIVVKYINVGAEWISATSFLDIHLLDAFYYIQVFLKLTCAS